MAEETVLGAGLLVVGRLEGDGPAALLQRWVLSDELARAVVGGMRNACGEPQQERSASLAVPRERSLLGALRLQSAAREAEPPAVIITVFRAYRDDTATAQEWSLAGAHAQAVSRDIREELGDPQREVTVHVTAAEDGNIELGRITMAHPES